MLTQRGVCEQAEHVKSPQEMEYDVMMKTLTNLCRNIGVHTKPLNEVCIRKNVSCGSFYNTEAENYTTLIRSIFHISHLITFGSRHFNFQFSFGKENNQYMSECVSLTCWTEYTHRS